MNRQSQIKILVTGAAGLLGSHLVDSLLHRGFRVTGIDNLSIGQLRNLEQAMTSDRFSFHKIDVCRRSDIIDLEPHHVIVHLAAYKIEVPGLHGTDILEVNSQGTSCMLEMARRWRCRFVFGSTSDVYGKSDDLPFKEDSDLVLGASTVARWGYASSKLFDEHLCFANQRRYGIPATVIRYFNTYGPRHDLTVKSGGPQALFFDALLRGKKMIIHGDGLQRRAFSYVGDTIEMTTRVIERRETEGEIINIGNPNEDISIKDLALLAWDVMGCAGVAPIEYIPHEQFYKSGKFEEIMCRIPDIEKASRLLDYVPHVSIRAGMTLTLDWQRNLDEYVAGDGCS
ncbi:NAD-dependent epimerase/dehydratase family protein [bacterium]|nr:NAD-dependent epimerase/dehydratase family protein [candidate division CSSED10-310 bacterium]